MVKSDGGLMMQREYIPGMDYMAKLKYLITEEDI